MSAADVGSRNWCAGDRLHTRREAEASSGGEAAVWGAGPLTVRRGLLGAAGVPVQGSARGSARVAFTCGSSCCQRYRALAVAGQKNCSATTTMAVVAEQFFYLQPVFCVWHRFSSHCISHGDMISRNLGGFALCGKKLIVPVMRACYEGFALITGYELFALSTFLIMRLIVPQVWRDCRRRRRGGDGGGDGGRDGGGEGGGEGGGGGGRRGRVGVRCG